MRHHSEIPNDAKWKRRVWYVAAFWVAWMVLLEPVAQYIESVL